VANIAGSSTDRRFNMGDEVERFDAVAKPVGKLALIGVAEVDKPIGKNGEMTLPVRVKVYPGTDYVSIVVRGVAMNFLWQGKPACRPLGDIRWQTEITSYDKDKEVLEFNIVAQLMCDKTDDPWKGNIQIDVLCYGNPKS